METGSKHSQETLAKMRKPVAPRFWSHVQKDGARILATRCWRWDGWSTVDGYGQMRQNNKTIGAHRVSWEIHYGPVPAGKSVLHHCDNPPCPRPDHLYLGTQKQNLADMCKRGRSLRGKKLKRLTRAEMRSVVKLYRFGTTQKALAASFGVCIKTIRKALSFPSRVSEKGD